jgi:hypothetical protein
MTRARRGSPALTRQDAEVLQRRREEVVTTHDRFADGQRLAKERFGGRDVLLRAEDIGEVVEIIAWSSVPVWLVLDGGQRPA